MYIEVKLHRISAEKLISDYIERRLHFALSRFGERVGRVTTRISAHVGNRSDGLTCRITADLRPFGVISAEASDTEVFGAVDRCIGRLARQCHSKCTRSRNGQLRRVSIRVPNYLAA